MTLISSVTVSIHWVLTPWKYKVYNNIFVNISKVPYYINNLSSLYINNKFKQTKLKMMHQIEFTVVYREESKKISFYHTKIKFWTYLFCYILVQNKLVAHYNKLFSVLNVTKEFLN